MLYLHKKKLLGCIETTAVFLKTFTPNVILSTCLKPIYNSTISFIELYMLRCMKCIFFFIYREVTKVISVTSLCPLNLQLIATKD